MKIASLCINTGLLYLVVRFLETRVSPKVIQRGASIISRGSFFWLVSSALFYVFTPSYFNYIESNIASVTQYWLRGHDIYTSLAAPEQYSILYGPWPMLASSLFQRAGVFVIQASKLMGFLNLLASLFVFSKLLAGLKLPASRPWLFLGFFTLALLGFDNFSYVNRPDSYLIAYVIVSLFLVETLTNENRLRHCLGVGILLGLCVASKIHGFAYFIPLAAYGYERHRKAFTLPLLVFTVLVGVVTSVLPFTAPQVSLTNFRLWLKVCAQHGLLWELFTDNLTYIGIYFVPLVLAGFYRAPFRLTFWALALASLITCIFGSLIGAGTHHLSPFLAIIFYFLSRTPTSRGAKLILAALFLGLTYDAFMSQKAMVNYFSLLPTQAKEAREVRELQSKYEKFGTVELGYGDTGQKSQSYYKPELLARGGNMLIEECGLMDSGFSGMAIPPQTLTALESCAVSYFILPQGSQSWQMKSGYGLKLFSDEWIRIFFSHYRQIDSSSSYTVWKCQP